MYPFKNIALNRNRKIIAVANPSADITQMVATAVPGVADNYRGVWDPSGTYTNGEMVLYSNVVWLCLASTTTATPATGSTVWQAIGSYSAFLGAWSSSTAYVVGDEVTYGGNFYFCTTANTNQTPTQTSSSYWQIAGPASLANVADDPLGGWRKVRGINLGNLIGFKSLVGDTSGDNTTSLVDTNTKSFLHATMSTPTKATVVSAPDTNGSYLKHAVVWQPHINPNQIGWGHFVGDTSGNYSGNLVDGLNLRFLHGAMSGPTQNTVAGTADSNGSYLQHGVVFNPHLTAGAIGFKNFLGDTSGDVTTNLVDADNKRFLHGAMSTGVQGVISSGSQVNVNPTGGVTGNLPYANHDVSVRTSLAPSPGGDGSYLNDSQIFNRHLNQANAAGLVYTTGGTVDSLKPAQAGADVTGLNTALDTTNVSGVPSPFAAARLTGFQCLSNPNFNTGLSPYTVYDNNATGNVAISLVTDNASPSTTGTVLQIVTSAGAAPDPGLGGFYYPLSKSPAGILRDTFHPGDRNYVNLIASIPVGYILNFSSNSLGTGGSFAWKTSQAGTGTYQLYQLLVLTGTDAFATMAFPFFYLTGGAAPVTWKVAQLTVTDIDQPPRFGVIAIDDGERALIDLSQSGHLNKDVSNINDDPAGVWLRFKGTQQTALLTNQAANHILDPGFTSIADFWGDTNSASAGVLNQGTVAASGSSVNFNYDGRGNQVKVKLDPGDTLVLQLTSTQAPTGTASTYLAAEFLTAAGALISYSNAAQVPATGTGTGTSVTTAPATCAYAYLFIQTSGGASGGNAALVKSPQARINHETASDPNALKAYVDFSDTTSGGHVAKSNWADATQMGTNIQGGTGLTDGETITFASAYAADPEIVFGDGGLTYDSTLGAVSQFQDFSASFTHSGGLTTGFTAALKISTVGGALTNHSQNFASDSVTLSIASGVIANGALTVSGNVHNSQSEINIITITLTDTTHSISWQKNVSVPAAGNKPFSFAITDTSAANGTVFTLGYSSGGSDSGTPTISYQTQTAATVHSATPAGVPGVNWVAFSTS